MARASGLRRRLERGIEALGTAEGRRSRFSSAWAYRVDGLEFLHFHSDHEVDLRLTRALIRERREQLAADPRVRLGTRDRDWVSVTFAISADVDFLIRLVRLAISANARS